MLSIALTIRDVLCDCSVLRSARGNVRDSGVMLCAPFDVGVTKSGAIDSSNTYSSAGVVCFERQFVAHLNDASTSVADAVAIEDKSDTTKSAMLQRRIIVLRRCKLLFHGAIPVPNYQS